MKPFDAFFKCATNGSSSYCKPCAAAYKRKGDKSKAEMAADVYPADGMRRCAGCLATKALADFNVERGGKIKSRCKACQYEGYKSWKSTQTGCAVLSRQARSAVQRGKRFPTQDTAVCSGCAAEKPRSQFGAGSGGTIRRVCKDCRSLDEAVRYAANKDDAAAKRAEYRAANLERVRAYARDGANKRRAVKAGLVATLTGAEWLGVLSKYGNRCLRCGTSERITLDHVVPISKGGAHSVENVQPLCGPCNSSKHTKTVDYRTTL